jgi:hypothetical protein
MVLKQRFSEGKTHFIDIGDNFLLLQPHSDEWKHNNINMSKDAHAVIMFTDIHGKSQEEWLYKDFPQWIYTNDGQLFLNLTSPDFSKKI